MCLIDRQKVEVAEEYFRKHGAASTIFGRLVPAVRQLISNRLRMESYGKEMFLHLSDDSGTELIEPMTITGIAHRQIGTHLRIPAAYYDRMREERPDLLAYNANTWFKQENSQRIHFETSTTHYYIKPRPFVLAVLNPRRQTLAACA